MLKSYLGALKRRVLETQPEICMDVAEWSQKRGNPTHFLWPPLYPAFEKLFEGFDLGLSMLASHKETLSRKQMLVEIEGATIRDKTGIVELPDRKIVFEGNWWLQALTEDPVYRRRFAPRSRRVSGNVYSVLNRWAGGYYHWLNDVLPRLEACVSKLPPDCKFLIPENAPAWKLDSLAAYGVFPDRMIEQPDNCHTRVERLWFATPAGQTGLGSAELIKAVARRLKSHFKTREASPELKIYVSREKSWSRKILNEKEVLHILTSNGFTKLFAEDCTLQEQVEVFSNACAIVSSHGSALTNMIFSPAGCVVGEFNHEDEMIRAHHRVLAMQIGFSRFFLPAPKANEIAGWEYDMVADLDKLSEFVKILGMCNR
jgi:hypothetical protein